jgi:hypothetical protein
MKKKRNTFASIERMGAIDRLFEVRRKARQSAQERHKHIPAFVVDTNGEHVAFSPTDIEGRWQTKVVVIAEATDEVLQHCALRLRNSGAYIGTPARLLQAVVSSADFALLLENITEKIVAMRRPNTENE